MLPSILVSNKRAYQQFKAEALVSMKLTHPSIVNLRAFEENDDNPSLIMDYIDGKTLDDYLADRIAGGAPVGRGFQPRRDVEAEDARKPLKEQKGVQLWGGGPYWAETNIGAKKPEDYGYHFWWGDTVGYKRVNDKWVTSDGSGSSFSFNESNTPTEGKSVSDLRREGWITEDGVLAPKHDAAQAHWGGNWRMPTRQDFEDLRDKCAWEWTKMNGVYGYRICGKGAYASASIFLPAAGVGLGTSLNGAGSIGYYWSSVPYSVSYYYGAWGLDFDSGDHDADYDSCSDGQSVRAVQGFTK